MKPDNRNLVKGEKFYWDANTGEKTNIPVAQPLPRAGRQPQWTTIYDKSGKAHEVVRGSREEQTLLNAGGSPGKVSPVAKATEDRTERYEKASLIAAKNNVSSEAEAVIPVLNRTSPDSASTAWYWKPREYLTRAKNEGAQQVRLPAGITMRDVRKTSEKHGKTIDEVLGEAGIVK